MVDAFPMISRPKSGDTMFSQPGSHHEKGSKPKRLIVFVHGFGSSAECWTPLIDKLREDPLISDFGMECFEYPSKWFEFNFLRSMPSLRQVAQALSEFLERRRFDYKELTLVGHSQGGLIIQRCLIELLHSTHGDPLLERIRQIILIATPNLGSTTLSPLRKLLSRCYFFNQQEHSLRVFDEEIDSLRKEIQEKVVEADRRTSETWPIPVQCFYGLRDSIVPEASARGPFIHVESLDGDHFSVIKPTRREDFLKLRDAIVEPAGHSRIWEIDCYDAVLQVEPYQGEAYLASFGEKMKVIHTDNFARFDRHVTFARKNRCHERFEIRYRTRKDGFVKPYTSTPNEAEPHQLGPYFDYGTEYHHLFTPRAGETFSLKLGVYKGFEEGNRDLHFHLGQRCIYKRFAVQLDLTAYQHAGYVVTKEPLFFLHPKDPSDHGLCEARETGCVIEHLPTSDPSIWRWELHNIRDGVVDVIWDIGRAQCPYRNELELANKD